MRADPNPFTSAINWLDLAPQSSELLAHFEVMAQNVKNTSLLPANATGQSFEAQQLIAIQNFEKCVDPFTLIRIGDSELALLCAGYFPIQTHREVDTLLYCGGVDRDALVLRQELVDAVKNADLLGVHQHWKPVGENTALALAALGLALPQSKAVEVHVSYSILKSGSLFKRLSGKRVLLIGGLAEQLHDALAQADYRESYAALGMQEPFEVAGFVSTPGLGSATKWWLDLDGIMNKIENFNFDIALVSAGIPAKIIANRIKTRLGKSAWDMGYIFDALLDVEENERTVRPVLKDISWPKKISSI